MKKRLNPLFILWALFISSTNTATTVSSEDQVHQVYVSYYGRPGDAAGVDYWAGELDKSGGDLTAIIRAFGTSPEYDERFGSLSTEALINNLYQQMFSRDAESAGLAWWTQQIESGATTLQQAAIDIAAGAQNEDYSTLKNRTAVAKRITNTINTLGLRYQSTEIDRVKSFLQTVGHSDTVEQVSLQALLISLGASSDAYQGRTLSLAADASVTVPDGALLATASLSITQTYTPLLAEGLDAVGKAYSISANDMLEKPAIIELPVPSGESTTDLAILRIEDSGNITILQTDVVGSTLQAQTSGFSTFVVTHLKGLFSSTQARISGPDTIPVNTPVAYRETSFYDKVGLQFSWSRYYDGTTNGDSALNEGDDRSVYDSHSAVLMASQSGTMNLVVEVSIPGTTVKSRGYKRITVTDELLYGSELALSVAGPGTVLESASATFNANVINTGEVPISSWEVRTESRVVAACESACGTLFSASMDAAVLGEPGTKSLQFTATSSDGATGTASILLEVLSDEPRITGLSEVYRSNQSLTFDNPSTRIKLDAEVAGGQPDYYFTWTVSPNPENISSSVPLSLGPHKTPFFEDEITLELTEPGAYEISVSPSLDGSNPGKYSLALMGEKLSFDLSALSPTLEVNQDLDFEMAVQGGVLVYQGKKYDYTAIINWGDSNQQETIPIVASSAWNITRHPLSHQYSQPGEYTIYYMVLPEWAVSYSSLAAVLGVKKSETIVITEAASGDGDNDTGPAGQFNKASADHCPATLETASGTFQFNGFEDRYLYEEGGDHFAECSYSMTGTNTQGVLYVSAYQSTGYCGQGDGDYTKASVLNLTTYYSNTRAVSVEWKGRNGYIAVSEAQLITALRGFVSGNAGTPCP